MTGNGFSGIARLATTTRHALLLSRVLPVLIFSQILLFGNCRFSKAQVNEPVFNNLLTEFESQKLIVDAIEQDNQGFLWFGTYQGLIRFDGVGYKRYLPEVKNIHSVSDMQVRVLYKDSKGDLWVGTRNGLNRYNALRNNFERFLFDPANANSLPSNEVLSIAEDPEGNLWIGTMNGGLSKMTAQQIDGTNSYRFTNFKYDANDATSLSSNIIFSICFDGNGIGLVGTDKGLNVLFNPVKENEKISFYQLKHDPLNEKSIADDEVYKLFCDRENNVWLISQFGMIDLLREEEITNKNFSFVHFFPAIRKATGGAIKSASMFYIDGRRNCWLSTFENGLYRFNLTADLRINNLVNYFHEPSNSRSITDNAVFTVFECNDQSIWVGTASGVSQWVPLQEKFAVFKMPASGFQKGNISGITEDADNNLWMGTSDSDTLYAIIDKDKNIRKLQLNDKNHPPDRKIYITTLLISNSGDIYAGTSFGVFILEAAERKKLISLPGYQPVLKHLLNTPNNSFLVSNTIICMAEDADGKIWIGTGKGISRYDPESGICGKIFWNKASDEMNPAYIVRHLKATKSGIVWVATDEGLVSINARNNVPAFYQKQNRLTSSRISFIHESNDHQLLWLGTQQGLVSFDPKTELFQSFPSAGNNISIMAILEDGEKNLWISSQEGICKFNPANGDCKKFTAQNGLNSNHFTETTCYKAKDGRFFFGSEKGFQSFYPDSIAINTAIPPVTITDFKLFNQSILSGDNEQLRNDFLSANKMRLNYDQNFFSIDFAALSYENARENIYAYQLEGIDKDWVLAGNNRTATYTNIAPDHYVFRVKGANNYGVWNNTGAVLDITITPPWWKTWWFYMLCFLAIVSALYALYKYRINQIKKVFSIRSKIARDLHDDIGSTLSSISLMSQMAREGNTHPNKEEELFETISTASREAMELMSVIVWSVNPNNDKLSNILIRMREYASDILEACNIEVTIVLDDEVKDLIIPMEKRKDFYLVFKEAVNNMAKYSNAANAVIHLSREHGKMIMTIKDDGKGFEVEKLRSGNGLVNMQDRAKSIGGTLQIFSAVGKGTTIRLEMPVVT
ncbi:MAG TPA: two-component regulator propeller domain-containing protein [Chitinophagales bacterium]|nr:two-component regulator propeller domain-containing protein [Chitinophagales bacterium]